MKALLILLFSATLFAVPKTPTPLVESTSASTPSEFAFEIGGSLGLPALANLLLGFHFPLGSISGFVRASGMYHGRDRTNGIDVDLGLMLDKNPPLFQAIALTTTYNNLHSNYALEISGKEYLSYIGADYNLSIRGFFAKAGIAYALQSRANTSYSSNNNHLYHLLIQAGYSVLLNL